MQRTEDVVHIAIKIHQICTAPKMLHNKNAAHQRLITPKMHPAKDAL